MRAKTAFLLLLACVPLGAHPTAHFLNGAFFSLGMGVGEGRLANRILNSTQNFSSNSVFLGMQTKLGEQNYFTPFIGVGYYGYFSYRYLYMDKWAKATSQANNIDRYQVGVGANLLFNFYSKIVNVKGKRPKVRAFGAFGGLLAVANIWTLYFNNNTPYVRNNANIDAVFGLHMRFNRIKISLGIHMPIANETKYIKLPAGNQQFRMFEIVNNYKSSELFLNFTRLF
ncbi:outer membrane beta-barrel protein [Helicobacter ailurogastricus]|uniref:outer membrane beta-barrel protein n=1 Tax=Helicobacter ailurogastricus TaxID=1578720 RepID=UPI000CF15D2A|nr:outer membrane beta-barrel protein [Helicobacter ailurogastricus]